MIAPQNSPSEIERWTEEEDATLRRLWQTDMKPSRIAEELGRSLVAIYQRRSTLKLKPRIKGERANRLMNDPDFRTELSRLYKSGVPISEIVKSLDISYPLLYKCVHRFGLPMREPGRKRQRPRKRVPSKYSPDLVEAVRKEYEAGRPNVDIAREFNLTYWTVGMIADRNGFRRGTAHWTPQENETLLSMLKENATVEQIAEAIGRTPLAVRARGFTRGLDKTFPQFNEFSRKHAREKVHTLRSAIRGRVKSSKNIARKTGKTFDLTVDYMLDLCRQQNDRCFYTGAPLSGTPHDKNALSIDRIDSSRGYVQGNVVLCIWEVNAMKQAIPLDRFVALCRIIAKNHRRIIKEGLCSPALTAVESSTPVPERSGPASEAW